MLSSLKSARPRAWTSNIIELSFHVRCICPPPASTALLGAPSRPARRPGTWCVSTAPVSHCPAGVAGATPVPPSVSAADRSKAQKREQSDMRAIHKLAMLSLVGPPVEPSRMIDPHNSRRHALVGNAGWVHHRNDLLGHLPLLIERALQRRRAGVRVQRLYDRHGLCRLRPTRLFASAIS